MSKKRDLFISYHTDSSKYVVEKIVPMLESKGISCWYAPRDCDNAWAEVILQAIDSASMFLVIINEQSMNSEHVKNEINAAFSRYSKNQLSILIFKIDTSKLNATTEYYLGRIHMVNGVEPPFEDRLSELTNRILYTKENAENKKTCSESSQFKSSVLIPSLCFVGRETELIELKDSLKKYQKIFISGMGGVGKSELAKAFLVNNKTNFRSIMCSTYTTSLKDLIINDNTLGISNFFRSPSDETDDSYFERKIEFIKQHGTTEDVLLIDNFNVTNDDHLDLIMSLPISIIFTTRNNYENYYNLKLDVIKDENTLLIIFKKFYPKTLSADDITAVKRIFTLVGNHTLTITIIANMMKKQRISAQNMVEKLESRIQSGIGNQNDINNMISSIFEMSNISDKEKAILQNMTLVPLFGISTETFFDYCKLDSYESIDDLISKNIILHDSARDWIALHPIIYRTIRKQFEFQDNICKNYLLSIIERLNKAKYIEYTERDAIIENINHIMRILPCTSEYYIPFYLAASKAFHAFAKHQLTIEKIEVLNADNISLPARVEALTDIADAYRCMQIPDKLLEKANEAMDLCNKLDQADIKTKKLKSELIGRFGWYYHLTKDHKKSFEAFYEQLQIVLSTEHETAERIGWAYFNVALAKNHCKEHTEAITYFEKALEQFKAINIDFAIANTYDALCECYFMIEDYDKALEGLFSALEIFEHLIGEMHNDTAKTKHLIALCYLKKGDREKATKFQQEAIDCITKLGYTEIAKNWTAKFNQ